MSNTTSSGGAFAAKLKMKPKRFLYQSGLKVRTWVSGAHINFLRSGMSKRCKQDIRNFAFCFPSEQMLGRFSHCIIASKTPPPFLVVWGFFFSALRNSITSSVWASVNLSIIRCNCTIWEYDRWVACLAAALEPVTTKRSLQPLPFFLPPPGFRCPLFALPLGMLKHY